MYQLFFVSQVIGGSKGGARDARPPSLWVRILSFSCTFQEILDQILGWRPLLWEILDPPLQVTNDLMPIF